MPLKSVRGKNLPIGVDLGSSTVKLAQMRLLENTYELVATQAGEIPRECRTDLDQRLAFLADTIRGMMKSKTFAGKQCVLSIPAETTVVQHIKMPRLKAELIPIAIRAELEGKLPYPVDDAIVRHVLAGDIPGDTDGKQEMIAFSVSRETIDAYLAMSRRAKLDVIGVNVESCAIVECFSRLFCRVSDAERTILFIDMGACSTQVVFSHGHQIVFARNLQIGGEQFDQAIAEGLRIPIEEVHALRLDLQNDVGTQGDTNATQVHRQLTQPIDAMANELSKCLRYYESVFRSRPVERAIFLGGQAHDKQLCQSLARRLSLPAQIGDPLLRVKRTDAAGPREGLDQREPQPDWAVAVGLSVGAEIAA